MAKKRVPIRKSDKDMVLLRSGRICGFCLGLDGDNGVQVGQIAHLDKNNQNGAIENLMFMCFRHHNEYDSIQSQGVGLTIGEAKEYRAQVEELVAGEQVIWTKRNAQRFILDNFNVMSYIETEKISLAIEHELSFMDALLDLTSKAQGRYETCFHKGVRKLYERMGESLNSLYDLLATDDYIETSTRRKFNNKNDPDRDVQAVLRGNIDKVGEYAASIETEFKKLQQFAQDEIHILDNGVVLAREDEPEVKTAPLKKVEGTN